MGNWWAKTSALLSKSADGATTVLGLAAGFAMANNISVDKLIAGDTTERNKAIAATAIGGLGWLTNRKTTTIPPK